MRTNIMEDLFSDVEKELERARAKFPNQSDIFVTLSALTEEVGELNKAILQANFERDITDPAAAFKVAKEAIQVMVMCIRVLHDCDLNYVSRPEQNRTTVYGHGDD